MFQSPFGELKIGKLVFEDTEGYKDGFQSPFGELKIGKRLDRWNDKSIRERFQSPFGELKIGKVNTLNSPE